MTTPMPYRSIGINAWKPFDRDLIQLAAELGFNDLQFTVTGSFFDLYFDFRGRATDEGVFDLAKKLGMTTTLWVREFYNQNSWWGPPTVENELYWAGLRRRYIGLAALFPEINYFILTLVESDRWVVAEPPEVIEKAINTINDALRRAGKTLIARTFVWHREHALKLGEVVRRLPENILISTKCVGNDWNYRQPNHPLIGNVGQHRQIVEMNLFGTWQREHYVANAYAEEIKRRFEDWVAKGVSGIFVPPDGRSLQSRPIGNAQEVNLWVIGRLAAGESDVDKIWHDFAARRFGETAAETMIKALRPTGAVLDEAVHVGREMFGHVENGIPALRMMLDRTAKAVSDEEAVHVPEDLHKYDFKRDPFTINFSTWRWDPSYIPTYQKIRKGDPTIIAEKAQAYAEQLDSAQRSLTLLDTVKDKLPAGGYNYIRFKLEENEFHLIAMCEAELAWLKASNLLYLEPHEAERDALRQEIENHLAVLEKLAERTSESLDVEWQGISYHLKRGEYINLPGYVDEFRRYWGMEKGPRHQPRSEEYVDTRYGKMRIVHIGPTTYSDWSDAAVKWDLSDRHIIWVTRRALTPPDQPVDMPA